VEPYFVGKPNPLMMREGLNKIQAHSETSVMVGDRMDTDVLSGLEAGMRTFLVLTRGDAGARGGAVPVPTVSGGPVDRGPDPVRHLTPQDRRDHDVAVEICAIMTGRS
jgi:FMN phosphatase YigB (HAD superfamily)